MTHFLLSLVPPAALCTILVLLVVRRRLERKPVLEIAPGHRSFFRGLGLADVDDFLALAGDSPHIVSGHPDRNVVRVVLGTGPERQVAYLKRERNVGRLSRSLREARVLQALGREGMPAPQWLAAGEDGRGRAFLLVSEGAGTELRSVLQAEVDSLRRRRIARAIGRAMARLHDAGYRHPDVYANHLLIGTRDDSVCILDWQRARLLPAVSWRQRRQDLAALHATVADALATPRERLACLFAYLRATRPIGVAWRAAVRAVEAEARRLLRRRHVREKRQPPSQRQAWLCRDGEALCVTPALHERCGGKLPDFLREARGGARRWPTLPGGGRGLLVRGAAAAAERQAALLLRLQRHGVPAPQVLALDRRPAGGGGGESLLLTEPLTDTCSLEAWLTRGQFRPASSAGRRGVLRQAGTLLRRLHEASCYLDVTGLGCGLAVRRSGDEWVVVLESAEGVSPRRRRQPRREARDVRRMQRLLRAVGCGRTDLCRFRAGYLRARDVSPSSPPPSTGGLRPPLAGASVSPCGSLWRRLVHGVRRLCQRPDWSRFAGDDWAERILEVEVTDRFQAKQGRSTGRWVLRAPAGGTEQPARLAVYLKRHYAVPRWQGWLAALWPGRGWSPALREWRNLEWARRQGLPVPPAVAAAEYVGPWGELRSALAVEELTGMVSLQEAVPLAAVRQDAAAFRRWKRGLTAELARLTRMLHDRRHFHRDLYLCHFFIDRADTRGVPAGGWRGRLHLIDMHRLARRRFLWRVWQTKDLAQLLYSSDVVGLDARDRLWFWRLYRGGGPSRPACRWVRRFVLYRGWRYRRHNARLGQAARAARPAA